MSLYLRALARCEMEGKGLASSDQIAKASGVRPTLVRKDLAHFGQFGIRGVGYEVRLLRTKITEILGLNRDHNVVIVGAGNLGLSLADARGFNTGGFRVVALFDTDPNKISTSSREGAPILAMRELPEVVKRHGVEMAVLAVTPAQAQAALDALGAAGVRAVMNFVAVRLKAPRGVLLRTVDLKIYLEGIAYWLARNAQRRKKAPASSVRPHPAR
jgi:redox-sensing transcriptional repressor